MSRVHCLKAKKASIYTTKFCAKQAGFFKLPSATIFYFAVILLYDKTDSADIHDDPNKDSLWISPDILWENKK